MNVQGILRGKKNITETWQGRIKIKIVFLCNIYLLSWILLGGQLTLSTMTQHAGVHARVSVLFPDRKSLSESEAATHWQQRPFVSAKLQLTRMALLACVWPQGLKPRDFPRSMQPGRASPSSPQQRCPSPQPPTTGRGAHLSLKLYKKRTRWEEMNVFNKCQSAAVLPASFLSPW